MNQGFPGSATYYGAFSPLWLVAVCLSVTSLCFSQEGNPSEMWYRAFLTYESALELESNGSYLEALNKCNEAKALYDGLAYNFPKFQPDIVKFKQKIVADTRLRIKDSNRQKVYGNGPSNPPPPSRQQQIPRRGDLPNIDVPRAPIGGSSGGTPVSPPQTWGGKSGNVLPRWDRNPRVGRQANEILNEVGAAQVQQQSIIDSLKRENQRLISERDSYQARLSRLQSDLDRSRTQQEEQSRQLAAYERDPGNRDFQRKAAKYKELLKDTMSQLKASTDLNASLMGELAVAQETIKRQSVQIKELEKERDNFAKIIQGKEIGSEAIQDLMQQNEKLNERLVLLEKVARRTSADNKQKEQDIALLKSEVAKVREERERLVVENVRHQQQIEGLQKKLQLLSDGLSEDDKRSLANMAPEQKAENELLRSMVLKQLRRQAQLKTAKDLLLRQLDRVGARSSVLGDLVEDMARGTQLSPEEKALFRAPQFAELLAEAEPDSVVYNTLSAPAGGSVGGQVFNGQKLAEELSQLDKSARLDFKEGRLAEAEQGFLKYLHFRPRSVPCICNLGILKIAMKNYSEAQQYLQKAIAMDKQSGLAFYLLGRTYFLQEKYDEALSHLEQGIQLQPNNAKAHNCVGVIASQKGWVSKAERAFSRAVDIDPKMGDAHFNLAVLYSSNGQGNFEKAKEHYFKALELRIPRDAAIENYLKNTAEIKRTPTRGRPPMSLGKR